MKKSELSLDMYAEMQCDIVQSMISHYTRQSTYHTFFGTQFDNRMYSMPDYKNKYSGWKWVHISTLRVSHLHHAVRLQMLAIQKIEEILADLFLDEGSKENHRQIYEMYEHEIQKALNSGG